MRPTRLTALIAVAVAALIALLPAAAGAVSRTDAQQWAIGGRSPSVNVGYSFKNLINTSYVRYGKRTWGVDLVWGSSSSQWSFMPDTGSPNIRDHRRRAMVPGEKVAIYNDSTRRYLVYGHQTFGINLTWSRTPSYQWKIGSDSSTGNTSLFNTVANDYVVYGERPVGINLRWLKDVKKRGAAERARHVPRRDRDDERAACDPGLRAVPRLLWRRRRLQRRPDEGQQPLLHRHAGVRQARPLDDGVRHRQRRHAARPRQSDDERPADDALRLGPPEPGRSGSPSSPAPTRPSAASSSTCSTSSSDPLNADRGRSLGRPRR